jgi:hypothetical protein
MTMPVVEIGGSRFRDLDGFSGEFSTRAPLEYRWRGNLDAFNDILRGGFGTPEGGFVLRWLNSSLSIERLGHGETVKWLEGMRQTCDPSNGVCEVVGCRAPTRVMALLAARPSFPFRQPSSDARQGHAMQSRGG